MYFNRRILREIRIFIGRYFNWFYAQLNHAIFPLSKYFLWKIARFPLNVHMIRINSAVHAFPVPKTKNITYIICYGLFMCQQELLSKTLTKL